MKIKQIVKGICIINAIEMSKMITPIVKDMQMFDFQLLASRGEAS